MNNNGFPPAISLTDIATLIGVSGVRDLALAAGGLEIAPKDTQVWRIVLEQQIVIGYERTAVVAGRDKLLMELAAARLRRRAMPGDDTDYRDREIVLDMAVVVRDTFGKPGTIDNYMDVLLHFIDMDDTPRNAVKRALLMYAPSVAGTLDFAHSAYEQGVSDGLDISLKAEADVYGSEDDDDEDDEDDEITSVLATSMIALSA